MLAFNKLVLTGFKSFVDPTELLIEPGLSAVVGPNGCGKSNLLEALRWVMGENSAKRVRGGEMDDVIFGGSSDRPARNIAEVKLIIGNRAKEAPAVFNEFEDIEVTRRIEREKGSRYRVNGRESRARDVQLLFADAGSGAQSNSLVGQGRIGALIGAKPTERRVLLEEAAGISGLYSRRHEAELRLRAAETNLTRLDDIHETLHAQLRSLARQAKQAERYRALNEEIRKLEATVFYLDWLSFNEARETAKAAVRAAQKSVADCTHAAGTAGREAFAANDALKAAREKDTLTAMVLQRLEHERENLKAEHKRRIGGKEGLERQISKLREDRMRETALLEEAKTAQTRLGTEQQDLNARVTSEQNPEDAINDRVETAGRVYAAEQAKLDDLTQHRAIAEAERRATRKSVYDLECRLQALEHKIKKTDSERSRALAVLEALSLSEPAQSPENLEAAQNECDTRLTLLEEAREKAAGELEQYRADQRELESAQKSKEAEANGLKAALNASASSGPLHNQTSVLDLLSVTPGYEAALAAALGDDLDAPLTGGNTDRAWTGQGAFGFIADFPAGLAGNLKSLAEFVDAPDALSARLNFIAVADTPREGAGAAAGLKPGQRLVSKAGDLWRWDGYAVSATFKGPAGLAQTRLVQRNRLKALESEISAAAPKLATGLVRLEDLQSQQKAREEELAGVRRERRRIENELSGLRGQLAKTASEKAQTGGLLENLNRQLSELSAQRDLNLAALKEQNAAVKDESGPEALIAALNDKRATVSRARLALSQAEGERDRLKYERDQRQARLNLIAMELKSWAAREQQAASRQADFDQRLSEAGSKLESARKAPDEVGGQLTALALKLDRAAARRKAAGDALAVAESNQLRLTGAEREASRLLSVNREALVRAEAQVAQAEERLTGLVSRIRERLAVAPHRLLQLAEVEEASQLPGRDEAETRRQRALTQREAMGGVNLRAEQETEELRSDLARHENEREDVQAAVAKLREGIDELNAEGRGKLLEAFTRVQAHFRTLFTRLFGGGEAELALVDSDDPLEAGLQVLASPPGKKMQILSLLSGGEQALTAMSLLFAVFMTKPAPVCVLDEVDAPLDDENCIRFCALIRDMARQTGTRFLVVTHNPHTMARVDRLFGVTMAEKGVSRLMSVNLSTAESLTKNS